MTRAIWSRSAGLCAVALASLVQPGASSAGPTGEQVVAGQAEVTRQGNQTTIVASDNSVIRFDSFDVGAQESVQFVQPDARSRVLNQILGNDPTRMDGSLTANGQVFIVNPAGVIFGRSAVVNVGGLVAAAGSMSSEDFLANRDVLTQLSGPVENHGKIEAGVIALFGQSVLNAGELRAPDGLVTLVAGGNVYIGRPGSNIVVRLDPGQSALRVVDPGIQQRGAIVADEVDMVVGDLQTFAMSPDATVQASDIRIAGGDSAFVSISGTLDASTREPGRMGGRIEVRGADIALRGATLDASGMAGGGSVMLGGDAQGAAGSSAATVAIDARSVLSSDALERGNGGHIMIDAIEGATIGGRMTARGGLRGGDGGLIEMSGRRWLDVSQMPDVGAPQGKPGEWLMNARPGDERRLSRSDPLAASTLGPLGLAEALQWLECVMNRDCDPDRAAFDDPRLQTDEQQALRRMYREVFGIDRQVSGRRALLESVEAFRARPGAADEIDGAELLRFLLAHPEESSVALRYLGELSDLVEQWKRTQIGVADADLGAACMLQVGLGIEGLDAAEIYKAVEEEPLQGEARCP